MTQPKFPPAILEAINKVMTAVPYVQKASTNTFQNYKYVSDGDILAKVQPAMAVAGLVFFQDELKRETLADGTLLAITYGFTLAHISGAVWPITYHRTGMSRLRSEKGGYDDKVSNKCQTAARKYFILGLFLIPTGEDEDLDAHDGDAKPKANGKGATKDTSGPTRTSKPTPAPKVVPVEPKDADKPKIKAWCDATYDEIAGAMHMDTLLSWENDNKAALDRLAGTWTAQHERLTLILKERYLDLEPANA